MSGTQQQLHTKRDKPLKKREEPALRGTFVSVLLLGAFIAVSWIGVFVLFIVRN